MIIFCHSSPRLVDEHQPATSVHGNRRVAFKADNRFPLRIALLVDDRQRDKVHPFRRGRQILQDELGEEGNMGSSPKRKKLYETTLRLTEDQAQAVYWWCERWLTKEEPTLNVALLHIVLMALDHIEQLDEWTRAHERYCAAELLSRFGSLEDSIAQRPPRKRVKTGGK